MTDEEITERVAEKLGWEFKFSGACGWFEKDGKIMAVKNFCNDANVMAKVLETIHINSDFRAMPERWHKFRDFLCQELGCGWMQSAILLRAKPKQQALAFLKLIEWESKNHE